MSIDEELNNIKKISKYIKIDFKLYEKELKKAKNKTKKQVVFRGNKYTTQEDFIKDYQCGAIDNISMKRYYKIIEKLEPVYNANIDELNDIYKFLLYYSSSENVNDLYLWWKNQQKK